MKCQYFKTVLDLVPKIWSILVSVPWVLEKNVCSVGAERCVLLKSMRLKWLIVLFISSVSLLIFHIVLLLITNIRVLKLQIMFVDLSLSSFSFVSFSFTYREALLLST